MNTYFEEFFSSRNEYADLELSLSRIDDALSNNVTLVESTKVIHIAGTNGKGSTSQFIASMLHSQGYTTLLFTSPHIVDITERIRYKLENISIDKFNRLFDRAVHIVEDSKLTYFETLFLINMMYCQEIKPDFLILETGLGGRFDATNTNFINEKTPVITTMGQDHTAFLGSKIADILDEKLAIVKNNSPVFIGHNKNFVLDLIKEKLKNSELIYADDAPLLVLEEVKSLYSAPFHYNYINAYNVVNYLLNRNIQMLRHPLPPCRQERIGGFLLDGAHNASGVIELLSGMNEMPPVAVVSSTMERDLKKFCSLLSAKIPKIITTTIPDNDRSYFAENLQKLGYECIPDVKYALDKALEYANGGVVLVCGSLYLCAYVRKLIQGG